MAYIKMIEDGEATGELKELYDGFSAKYGFVPIMRTIFSIKPGFVKMYDQWVRSIMFGGSSLGKFREELIALIGSKLNQCSH